MRAGTHPTDVGGPGAYGKVQAMGGPETPREFDDLTDEEKLVLIKVIEVLRRLKFGTVLLIVQDGKVVQIEMAEKIRLR